METLNLRHDPIIIIGMGTSGTRMVVRILEKCGIFMGGKACKNKWAEPMIFPNEINAFVDDFRYKLPLRSDWKTIISLNHTRIKEICATRLPMYYREAGYNGGPWGFKDPRSTFTISVFLKIFPQARILHIIRDGIDVAESKQNEHWGNLSNKFGVRYWLAVWTQVVQVSRSWQMIVPSQYLEVKYEDLCFGHKETMNELANFCNFSPIKLNSVQSNICHTNRINKIEYSNLNQVSPITQELRRELGYS